MPTPPWIYLAAPLFTAAEQQFNAAIAAGLTAAGYSVYLPQAECDGLHDPHDLYLRCIQGLDGAALVLIVLDGTDADSGSCFELGYAYAKGIPIVGLRTDFRGSGEHMGINLMLTQSCDRLLLTRLQPHPSDHRVTYRTPQDPVLPLVLDLVAGYPALQA
jgi:nucleoside 2-deoxyribosyltransferase